MWLGFGALLPVLPLYFTEQGVDLALLGRRHRGLAGRPARRRADLRLAGRPDRARPADGRRPRRDRRLQPAAAGLHRARWRSSSCAPGPGSATAIYDPAARGYLTDATPPERRGEAFGLYGACQMGGLLHRAGDRGAGGRRGSAGSRSCSCSAASRRGWPPIPIALRGRESRSADAPGPVADATEFPPDAPSTTRRAGRRDSTPTGTPAARTAAAHRQPAGTAA